MNIETLKQRVSIEDVLYHYGWDGEDWGGTTGKKVLCPFHGDTNPSGVYYPDSERFKCYACGIKGDVIDVVQQVERIESLREAMTWIETNLLST